MESHELTRFIPLWVREHPIVSLVGAIGGPLVTIIGLVLKARSDAGDALGVFTWFGTNAGVATMVLVGALLVVGCVALPVILGGLGVDLSKHRRTRKEVIETLAKARDAIRQIDTADFDACVKAGPIQQTYVIRALRRAAVVGITPVWLDGPLSKQPDVGGAWVALLVELSERTGEILHPDNVAGHGASVTAHGTLTWATTHGELPIWIQYSCDAIDLIIKRCLTIHATSAI